MKSKLLQSRVAKNAGWLIGAKVAQMLINLAVSILVTRFLGPSNFGLINYGTAYTAFFLSLCTLGLNSILVKEFVDCRWEQGTVLGTALVLRAISSALSAVMILCIVSIVDRDDPAAIAVTALCSLGLLFNIFDVFNYWFQSRLESKVTALAALCAYVVTAVYKVALYVRGKSVTWFAFATSVDYIVLAVLLLACYRRHGGTRLRFSWACGRDLLKRSYHFILPGMMVAIYGYVDKFMLKHMINDAEIGYYSTAVSVCSMWSFVLSAIIDSVYPSIMEAYQTDRELYLRRNRQLYAIVFYVSAAVSVVIALLGKYVIWLLYGQAYLPAAAPLRVITWYTAFSYLGVARNAWVVCEGKQRYLKYLYLSAAAINVVLNLLLIPGGGAVGAAAASLLTQAATILAAPMLIPAMRENTRLMLQAILLRDVLPRRETADNAKSS